jgi:hypothetical protein
MSNKLKQQKNQIFLTTRTINDANLFSSIQQGYTAIYPPALKLTSIAGTTTATTSTNSNNQTQLSTRATTIHQ